MRYLSPLRYPGGKARLAPYLERLITFQDERPRRYAEPFAGGAGAALRLLNEGIVDDIHLNDLNPGIAAFWRAALTQPGDFRHRVATVELSIDEWKRQRAIYQSPEGHDDLELGFATFYLNRTNRSGILGARPIGGLDQKGKWKIDARFNRDGLIKRIDAVAAMAEHIHLTQMEGSDFIRSIEAHGTDMFVYADPPYIVQGEGLYLHAFNEQDHVDLADQLAAAKFPWMLTYDDEPRITDALYANERCATFEFAHTAHKQHVGTEAIIFSPNLQVPDMTVAAGRTAQWVAPSPSHP